MPLNSGLLDNMTDTAPQSRLYPHYFVSEYLLRLKERREGGLTDDPLRFDLVTTFESLTEKLKEEAAFFFRKHTRRVPLFANSEKMPLRLRRSDEEETLWREMTLDTRFYTAYQALLLPSWAIKKGFFFHRSHIEEANYLYVREGEDCGIPYGVILCNPTLDKTDFSLTLLGTFLLPLGVCSVLALFIEPRFMGWLFAASCIASFLLFRDKAERIMRNRKARYETLKQTAFARFQKRLKAKGGTGVGLSSRSAYVSSAACYDELVRMLNLFSVEPGLATRSEYVDMLWHEFISDTILYRILCRDILQRTTIVNHVPSTQQNDPHIVQRYQDFLLRYMKAYQAAPPRKFWPYEVSTKTAPSRQTQAPAPSDAYNDGMDVFLPYGLFGLGYSLGSDTARAEESTPDTTSAHTSYIPSPPPSDLTSPSPSGSGDYGCDAPSPSGGSDGGGSYDSGGYDGGSYGGDSGGSYGGDSGGSYGGDSGGSCGGDSGGGDSGGSGCSSGCSC